jgi:hypothetical protein
MSAVASPRSRLCLSLMLAGLLLAPFGTTAYGALECSATAPAKSSGHWSWRNVDGKRCWYPGRPGMAKTNLRWTQSSPPTLARGDDEQSASPMASQRGQPRRQQPVPADSDASLLETVWPAPEAASFNERWPQ